MAGRIALLVRAQAPRIPWKIMGYGAAAGLSASFCSDLGLLDKAQFRKEVFQHTVAMANQPGVLNDKLIQKSIAGTSIYETRPDGSLWRKTANKDWAPATTPARQPYSNTELKVVDQDSFVAAKALVDRGFHPLVLNMANKLSIGGGVEGGSAAQEECLFRSSAYHRALYPWGDRRETGPLKGRMIYRQIIPEFGSYYSPSVQVFRDATKDYVIIPTFAVDCIAVAGYDLRPHSLSAPENAEYQADPSIRGKAGQELIQSFCSGTRKKLRHLLDVALAEGNDSLVLGAISCGAFAMAGHEDMMPVWVSGAMADVLNEERYRNKFRAITVAVLSAGNGGKKNFDVFSARFNSSAL